VFESRVLRRFGFGHRRDEVARGCRILHTEEFHNLYTSPDIIRVSKLRRRMWWAGHVAHMGEVRIAFMPVWKKPLRRPRRRWKNDIRMDLREIGWEKVDWIYVAQDRDQLRAVLNTVMKHQVP
jgi:hypothetical protein